MLVLFGPTASGKTGILKRLFTDNRIAPAEIISADSMQVYRGMDIGTAKPSPEDRAKIPHHLIDIRNPNEQFNAGEFVRLAGEAVFAAEGRGALPVVSGGTGFYLKNLVGGLPEAPPSDPAVREELKTELAGKGAPALMDELAVGDPVSASRIHINDHYRLLRALEVLRLTGRPLSSFSQNREPQADSESAFNFLILGLSRNREELYSRINERCSMMFRQGLPDEVRKLFEAGFTPEDPGLKAIGYKEFFVEDDDSGGPRAFRLSRDTAGVQALIAMNSRRYAKRQISYFASLPGVTWIDADREDEAVAEIKQRVGDFIKNDRPMD